MYCTSSGSKGGLGVSLPPPPPSALSEGRMGPVDRSFQAICPSPPSMSTSESAKGCEKVNVTVKVLTTCFAHVGGKSASCFHWS